MTDLSSLIARVEGASADSEDLFSDVFDAVFPQPDSAWLSSGEWSPEYSNWNDLQWRFYNFTNVGAWLDAAITLVPEGMSFEVRSSGLGDKGQATVWNPMTQPGLSSHESYRVNNCSGPAIALTAACLRARLNTEPSHRRGDAG